ncbi:hypothetical protein V2J09_006025 [Rumex salicifolius]
MVSKRRVQELEAQDRLLHFLINLSPDYDVTKNQILSSVPVPTLNNAYRIVLQVEKQKQLSSNATVGMEPVAFLAGSQGNKAGNQGGGSSNMPRRETRRQANEHKLCSLCNFKGHTADSCFEVIGYPDWYKGKRGKRGGKMAANVVSDETPLLGTGSMGGGKYSNLDPEFLSSGLLSREIVAYGKEKGGIYRIEADPLRRDVNKTCLAVESKADARRDVLFQEEVFPFREDNVEVRASPDPGLNDTSTPGFPQMILPIEVPVPSAPEVTLPTESVDVVESVEQEIPPDPVLAQQPPEVVMPQDVGLRRSTRQRREPTWTNDFVLHVDTDHDHHPAIAVTAQRVVADVGWTRPPQSCYVSVLMGLSRDLALLPPKVGSY